MFRRLAWTATEADYRFGGNPVFEKLSKELIQCMIGIANNEDGLRSLVVYRLC